MGAKLSEAEMQIQTCTILGHDNSYLEVKDYSSYLYFLTAYMGSLIVLFAACFQTEMHRTNADRKANDKCAEEEEGNTVVKKDTSL